MSQGLKDRELQEYYEGLFSMYASRGWQELMVSVEEQLREKESARNVHNVEELYFRKGELSMLDWLKYHQALSEHAYAHLLEQDGQDASDVQSQGVARVIDADAKDE